MSESVCERCDQPFGDSERADNHPAVKEWSAWVNAGGVRTGKRMKWRDVIAAVAADQPGKHTELTCFTVNWRTEALQLRADCDNARADRDRLAAEVERLRAEASRALTLAGLEGQDADSYEARMEQAQIERDEAVRDASGVVDVATLAIERAVDAALGEIQRQSGHSHMVVEARGAGIADGKFVLHAAKFCERASDEHVRRVQAVAERDEARAGIAWRTAALGAVADRISTIADEAFGPFPVQPADENLTVIERGIFELRQERDAAIRERDEAHAEVARLKAERNHLAGMIEHLRENAGPDSCAELLAKAIAARDSALAERDEAGLNANENARIALDEQQKAIRAEQARDSAVNDTAERIAAWLDRCGGGMESVARDIRAGAWRKNGGG